MLDGWVPWPAEVADAYRRAGYWRGETLTDALAGWAATYGERTALVGGDQRLTYTGLHRAVELTAARLHAHGVEPGDRIIVQLPNVPEFVLVFFALIRLGAYPVMALPAYRGNEIGHLASISGAVGYVIAESFFGFDYRTLAAEVRGKHPRLRHVFVVGDPGPFVALAGGGPHPPGAAADLASLPPAPADAGDVAVLLLSGGTTALPKLIPRTHDDYAYQARTAAEICGLSAESVYLAVLPIEFNFPLAAPGIIGTFQRGGRVVLAPNAAAEDCFALVARERVTITALVPTLVQVWLEAAPATRHDLSSLQLLQVGGAKHQRAVAERITPVLGCALQQVYGMTEGLLSFSRRDDPVATVLAGEGRPNSPGDEIRVVDEHGDPVPPGEEGELLARGPGVIRGYFRAPEHNARAFTADGFYRTGDLVRVLPDGNLSVTGRVKDVIVRGGDKVSTTEVEGHLLAHPDVRQVAVVPAPDALLGELVLACVVPGERAPTRTELRRFLRERGLAEFKLPDRYAVVDTIPLTPLGKVDKRLLVANHAEKNTHEPARARQAAGEGVRTP
jgi:2,3-dihydroxybenzoate-AMP ligase